MIFLSHVASSNSERCHPQDKMVLLQIKKELNNPTVLSSWKSNADCCKTSWRGVDCSPSNNRVSGLSIYDENNNLSITSKFPPSIGNLSYLDFLHLYDLPNLTGSIPFESLSKLLKLITLTITSTGLSGPIPNFPPQMKHLFSLDLSSNHFSGTLPNSLYKLPRLAIAIFNNNSLTGPIPPSYGYFQFIGTLYLSHNQLSGRLPISLARLINTYNIDLSYNKFEGDASMLFGSNKVISKLDLSQNMFKFDLGKVELAKNLYALDVSHNQIYGKLPLGIENLSDVLNVSYNKLCGKIPEGGNMHLFGVNSFFHNKCLCGSPLPNCK
ncbi:hypothetical protein TSUD_372310 [Trifolium subterraneum]|uniref:Leucine-rich repeat-containing N-terminal plant-type domain-containing protein n=1 Tax=Trifolium subterraneum TaxID=3900 RepID=A0A2Z6M8C6_TRISU|nr:hypothetical protein TSUD_372310 [Trifolium subterraneum]